MKPLQLVNRLTRSLDQKEADRIVTKLRSRSTEQARLELELFKVLRKSRSDDPKRIEPHLKDPKLVRYLSKYKHDLKLTILDELAKDTKDVDQKTYRTVVTELNRIDVLRTKGLEEEALRHIDKLYYGLDASVPIPVKLLVVNEKDRLIRSSNKDLRTERVKENDACREEILQTLSNQQRLKGLKEQVFGIYLEINATDQMDVKGELESLFKHELLVDYTMARSFEAQCSFRMAHFSRVRLLNDLPSMIHHLELMVELWDNHPKQIERRPYVYQRMLINLLNGYYDETHRKDFEWIYAKAVEVKLHTRKDMAASAISLLSIKTLFYMNTHQLERALDMRQEIDEGIDKHLKLASYGTAVNLLFNVGSVYFLNNDLREAKRWYNRIREKRSSVRQDLKGMAMIMMLLCDFDRDHSELVLPTIRSIKRYYAKHKEVKAFEGLVFKCIQDILKRPIEEESRYLLEALTALDDMDVKGKDILGGETVICWMMARLQGTSIRTAYESMKA